MTFEIEIDTSEAIRASGTGSTDLRGDLDELALPLCDLLDEAGVKFRAGGFGDDQWPVDVRFDLASIIPQLPSVIDSLNSGSDTELDFFEQGIQRLIVITFHGDQAVLKCHSSGKWKPRELQEERSRRDLGDMLIRFVNKLSAAVSLVAPELSIIEPFTTWARL
ncbi:hypothetical protein [Kutzneria buriramensis]|uniref:hypothetical protein n=1 Tax=Kutzneria buriramensis TaxID=1045776 RepID=UPI000E21CBF3|nr:hypothetical protein [Kutzneria buriramensis]